MDTIIKITLIMDIIAFLMMSRELYTVSQHGKLIINTNKNRIWATIWSILWAVMIISWCILGYLHYMDNTYDNILMDIFWIEISIYNIIRGSHSSEIRENGIYGSGNFYKWSKVKSYSWILPTTIQFKVSTFFKTNYSFEFTIKEELKSKVNETVQKHVI
ncbi:hypothetical protein [Clostridium estertheticum]|uniref:DUF5673 domain-containing protein n=1 Tax=Clostridium estertheticum subsp. estertheticum TaxID=1552 RepID=A0A1J0GEW6_9CLOT|nr:hypothetical protein [Clostridium estertheticum]APC39815.1 hypothetical protein A7L45_06890 [Clostridium estertheticum subsp. estertheticum]MBU3172021.1 hypothetical protein [Clostridium estertheticum]MBZ9614135.1 hypothetical protein [Clostridium estertheticum subsp. laramiense]WAG74083.1 hypothetical protein LL032_01085 [Clostridium estertheticum]